MSHSPYSHNNNGMVLDEPSESTFTGASQTFSSGGTFFINSYANVSAGLDTGLDLDLS